ncbi:hypothetical protein EDD86DRAFT_200556 [Gorgonomyces haynaldii]|nr:hypothetical protein EDD86DRAFT_200556 [Gorgonomyces haynaldii]
MTVKMYRREKYATLLFWTGFWATTSQLVLWYGLWYSPQGHENLLLKLFELLLYFATIIMIYTEMEFLKALQSINTFKEPLLRLLQIIFIICWVLFTFSEQVAVVICEWIHLGRSLDATCTTLSTAYLYTPYVFNTLVCVYESTQAYFTYISIRHYCNQQTSTIMNERKRRQFEQSKKYLDRLAKTYVAIFVNDVFCTLFIFYALAHPLWSDDSNAAFDCDIFSKIIVQLHFALVCVLIETVKTVVLPSARVAGIPMVQEVSRQRPMASMYITSPLPLESLSSSTPAPPSESNSLHIVMASSNHSPIGRFSSLRAGFMSALDNTSLSLGMSPWTSRH